jgi:hypothetical protein
LVLVGAKDVKLEGISARQAPNGTSAAAIQLVNVEDALVKDCRAQQGTTTFLAIAGKDTRRITIRENETHHAALALTCGEEVPENALVSMT